MKDDNHSKRIVSQFFFFFEKHKPIKFLSSVEHNISSEHIKKISSELWRSFLMKRGHHLVISSKDWNQWECSYMRLYHQVRV